MLTPYCSEFYNALTIAAATVFQSRKMFVAGSLFRAFLAEYDEIRSSYQKDIRVNNS